MIQIIQRGLVPCMEASVCLLFFPLITCLYMKLYNNTNHSLHYVNQLAVKLTYD